MTTGAGYWLIWACFSLGDGISGRIDRVDGKPIQVESLSFEPGWKLRGRIDRKPFETTVEKVVGIHFGDRAVPSRPRGNKLLLGDGSWLGARGLTFKDESFKLRADSFGDAMVPVGVVRAVVLDPDATPEQLDRLAVLAGQSEAKSDRVHFRNGDLAIGSIVEIDEASVVIERAGTNDKQRLGRELILGLTLDPGLAAKMDKPKLFGQLRLADGNTLTVTELNGQGDSINARTAFGSSLKIASTDLVDLAIRGGGVVYLSDLKPVEAKSENYLGESIRPVEVDRSAVLSPLAIGNRTFNKGLGVRSASHLTYDANGYERFEATVGVDERAGELASVRFLVLVDGKVEFDSGEMLSDTPAKEIRIEVKGRKRLELIVGFESRADAEDLADWCDARFIK